MAKEQFLDFKGLTELVYEIKDYISDQKVKSYRSSAEFPGIGEADAVYIDKQHNAMYRWDDEHTKYYRLAFDPEDRYIMNCGSSTEGGN